MYYSFDVLFPSNNNFGAGFCFFTVGLSVELHTIETTTVKRQTFVCFALSPRKCLRYNKTRLNANHSRDLVDIFSSSSSSANDRSPDVRVHPNTGLFLFCRSIPEGSSPPSIPYRRRSCKSFFNGLPSATQPPRTAPSVGRARTPSPIIFCDRVNRVRPVRYTFPVRASPAGLL